MVPKAKGQVTSAFSLSSKFDAMRFLRSNEEIYYAAFGSNGFGVSSSVPKSRLCVQGSFAADRSSRGMTRYTLPVATSRMKKLSAAAKQLNALPTRKATFVAPMECLSVSELPEGSQWLWEIKLDGYRALAVKSGNDVTLLSRNRKSLNRRFSYIAEALADLPDGTVADGELVAIDETGRPDFNLLQNFREAASRIHYYIFDLLVCKDRDLTRLPLVERRARLKSLVSIRDKRIRICDYVEASATSLLSAVREQHLEGIVGKRKDSRYEEGKRSGAWIKYRVNRGQEFVIGGYFPGPHGFDSLIVGYYDGDKLMYVARTRNGFVPASRRQVFSKLKHLVTPTCPFVNLPETRRSRFGEELSAEKMKKAVWLRPEAVAQIEFLEWTEGGRLRHSKFVRLREDKEPRSVVKEHAGES
jgi:DNA ligase D-like protein (predicted ligase)